MGLILVMSLSRKMRERPYAPSACRSDSRPWLPELWKFSLFTIHGKVEI